MLTFLSNLLFWSACVDFWTLEKLSACISVVLLLTPEPPQIGLVFRFYQREVLPGRTSGHTQDTLSWWTLTNPDPDP